MDYMEILGAKIEEARGQLSEEAQRFIKNSCDDLYVSAMDLSFKIEKRLFMNPQDEQDYNILLNIMHLIDMLMEFVFNDDDFKEFNEDVTIEIDED